MHLHHMDSLAHAGVKDHHICVHPEVILHVCSDSPMRIIIFHPDYTHSPAEEETSGCPDPNVDLRLSSLSKL